MQRACLSPFKLNRTDSLTDSAHREAGPAPPARRKSVLLVVDIQERLAPHVEHHEAVIARTCALIAASGQLNLPRRLTEHCPGQIGPVIPAVRKAFRDEEIFSKTRFGAAEHPEFTSMLRAAGAEHIVVAGMEAHVCVLQTVLGLLRANFTVTAVADAIGARSQRQADRQWALERMRDAGAIIAGTETVLFEWTYDGDNPQFRAMLQLVKSLP